jgi:hypothetical protein
MISLSSILVQALLAFAMVGGSGGNSAIQSVDPVSVQKSSSCPAWFGQAPRLGRGLPVPVPKGGLKELTVCRYLHALSGQEVIHHPPLRSDLRSFQRITRVGRVEALADLVDRLEPYRDYKEQALGCPNESSGGFYFRFEYRNGKSVSVQVIPTGCSRAIAGRRGRVLALGKEEAKRVTSLASPARAD